MQGLFDELKTNGEAAIDCWIEEKRGESLYFDCKVKKSPATPELDKDDRKNLAKALSAFANSDGGLLLLGVDAREIEGVDCLVCKNPIARLAFFKSNLEHAIADLISPPIPALEIYEIPSSEVEGAGYLAISVPSSERRPHMSRNNKEPGFFFRSGHKSVLMEVFQIRDQMLRRAVPKLEFEWNIRIGRQENARSKNIPVLIDLSLRNDSSVSARFPYLILRVDCARYVGMGDRYKRFAESGLPITRIGPIESRAVLAAPGSMTRDREFAGGADCCIHPGTKLEIASITLEAPADLFSHHIGAFTQQQLQPRYGELLTIIMEISYGCLDAPRERVALELKADEMQAKLFPNGLGGLVTL